MNQTAPQVLGPAAPSLQAVIHGLAQLHNDTELSLKNAAGQQLLISKRCGLTTRSESSIRAAGTVRRMAAAEENAALCEAERTRFGNGHPVVGHFVSPTPAKLELQVGGFVCLYDSLDFYRVDDVTISGESFWAADGADGSPLFGHGSIRRVDGHSVDVNLVAYDDLLQGNFAFVIREQGQSFVQPSTVSCVCSVAHTAHQTRGDCPPSMRRSR